METGKLVVVLATFAIILAAMAELSAAQGICNMTQEELNACKPACSTGAKPAAAKPSGACCTALGHADLACLCTYKTSPWLPIIGINATRAMELPSKCNISTAEQCG